MDADRINAALSAGDVDGRGLLPHVDRLRRAAFTFEVDFGLRELPTEPGVVFIRGPRQYGKSTWLESEIAKTVKTFGPGTAFYLNGDEIRNTEALVAAVRRLAPLFGAAAPVRRLFIDEVTAIPEWERGLKRMLDAGELDDVLVVTTGSRATDLRRGSERLPGRKGRLDRTSYLFTPVSYREFRRVCGEGLGEHTFGAYALSGGNPLALTELGTHGRIPEYVPEMVRDWIYGECAATGRNRPSLMGVLECLLQRGGVPVGQTRLAREAGLANNTVAAGYIELLADLMCVGISNAWDASRRVALMRKPAKFPFVNLLAAMCWHPGRLRSVEDFDELSAGAQGAWLEWLVAQELWRRAAIRGDESPERQRYWQSKKHELDFAVAPDAFVEVKRGRTGPLDFAWFPATFPGARLTVVGGSRFETDYIRGVTFEDFLLDGTGER